MENKGRAQQMILSTLTQEQHDNAAGRLSTKPKTKPVRHLKVV